MTSFELLACTALIAVSAFMSSSEIALFSLSRFQLRALKERFRPAYKKIKQLLADPGGLLVTILVINEIVNISLATIVTGWLTRQWTDIAPWLARPALTSWIPAWVLQALAGTLITAPLILFFGEITPKAIAAKANQLVASINIGPLSWIYKSAKPFRLALARLLTVTLALFDRHARRGLSIQDAQKSETLLREEDFLSMVEEGHREGSIQENELELIKNVFELDNRTVADVYTPLHQVYAIPSTLNLRNVVHTIRGKRYSRIPVTGAHRKDIVGILYSKDLLIMACVDANCPNEPVSSIMRKPLTVPPTMQLNSLFRRLKQFKTHMAVVETAQGECIGVVTMSDVLDALFEDVLDSDDRDERRTPPSGRPV